MKNLKVFLIYLVIFLFSDNFLSAKENDFNAIRVKAIEPYEEYSMYRGDLHVHTNLSADASHEQTIESVIKSAKERLDFMAITDHDEHLNDVLTKNEWNQIVAVCRNQNIDGEFVVFPGYEWTFPDQNFKPGVVDYEHKIVYFDDPPQDIFRFTEFSTPQQLAKTIEEVGGIGHTPHPRSFTVMDLNEKQIVVTNHERNHWSYDRKYCTIFPNAEYYPDGPPYRYDFDKRADDDIEEELVQISWELEIQKALSIGYKLGVIATSDTHWPNIKPGDERRTLVFANKLTRKDILDALKKRHNYAEVCPNTVNVWFSISEHIIGEEFETDQNPRLLLNIQSEREIVEVYIYKNNNKWITINKGNPSQFSPDFKEVNFTIEDIEFVTHSFYFVKIRLKGFNEYGIPFTVLTSPIWVNKGTKQD